MTHETPPPARAAPDGRDAALREWTEARAALDDRLTTDPQDGGKG